MKYKLKFGYFLFFMFLCFHGAMAQQPVQADVIKVYYFKTEMYAYHLKKAPGAENGVYKTPEGGRFAVLDINTLNGLISSGKLDTYLSDKSLSRQILYVLTENQDKLGRKEPVTIRYNRQSGNYFYQNR